MKRFPSIPRMGTNKNLITSNGALLGEPENGYDPIYYLLDSQLILGHFTIDLPTVQANDTHNFLKMTVYVHSRTLLYFLKIV